MNKENLKNIAGIIFVVLIVSVMGFSFYFAREDATRRQNQEIINKLARENAASEDIYGTVVRVKVDSNNERFKTVVVSAGRDREFNTEDDEVATYSVYKKPRE